MQKLGTIGWREYFLDDDGSILRRIPSVRECVRAGPGRKFAIADYSQIEVRLIAFMAWEPALIEPINAGRDIHSWMASQAYEISYDLIADVVGNKKKSHPEYHDLSAKRSAVKTVTFGLPYGAGPSAIARMIIQRDENGRPVETMESALARAKDLIERYFGTAPRLKKWLEKQGMMALQPRWDGLCATETIYGRKRFYPEILKGDPDYNARVSQIRRFAGNHPIQGTSADILKDACRRLYAKYRGGDPANDLVVDARISIVCHDEIVVNSDEGCVDEAKRLLEEAMTEAYEAVWYDDVDENGNRVRRELKQIQNKVDAIIADYWAKD